MGDTGLFSLWCMKLKKYITLKLTGGHTEGKLVDGSLYCTMNLIWQLHSLQRQIYSINTSVGRNIRRLRVKKPHKALYWEIVKLGSTHSSCVTLLPHSDRWHNAPCTLSNGDFNNLTTQLLLLKIQQWLRGQLYWDFVWRNFWSWIGSSFEINPS